MTDVGTAGRLAFQLRSLAGTEDEFQTSFAGAVDELLDTAASCLLAIRIGERHTMGIPVEHTGGHPHVEPLAAVELSGTLGRLIETAALFGAVLTRVADPGRSVVTLGPKYEMVAPERGDLFLSLSFRRDPSISPREFQTWWRERHGPLAIAHLKPQLLAYDQVHVDLELSAAAASAAGFAHQPFDAYDNVTWADYEGFLASIAKPGLMDLMREDERGFIDASSRFGTHMTLLEVREAPRSH
jgi:hypothetical protein